MQKASELNHHWLKHLKDDYDDLNILNEWDDYQGIMDDNHYNRL